ncbi:prephenate dehydrogenase [Clostridium tarantellae]|uniref:Prephenate dehydrogenase/arogenate dehydrogenase family protein n=1 Tax=Clostridium tarantellae TaxID=39493 RepID=A0A6I1MP49_9CLOT|nr:prephenate dehydrogenase [Clostridium tarantellae]MPQ44002.1 prephenate dehydrogenase/arogenate dehydrogenase family protein [Clostridium tarantellae]
MNITIVGLGVIGGSYAMALKESDYNIYGIDINYDTIKKAKDLLIIKDGALDNDIKSKEFIKKTDLLILCIYPKSIKKFIEKYKVYFKKGLIITDVTGIKDNFINEVENLLPREKNIDFIFCHPMAGREKRGLNYACGTIFKKANFIITPTENNKEENLRFIEELAFLMKFKKVKRLSAKEHDLIISFTSQLPHAIAVSLINSDNLNIKTGDFIGDSYRELTRIANINEDLWCELFLGNKNNLIKRIDDFQEKLDILKKCLVNEEEESLKEIFKESTRKREVLE